MQFRSISLSLCLFSLLPLLPHPISLPVMFVIKIFIIIFYITAEKYFPPAYFFNRIFFSRTGIHCFQFFSHLSLTVNFHYILILLLSSPFFFYMYLITFSLFIFASPPFKRSVLNSPRAINTYA